MSRSPDVTSNDIGQCPQCEASLGREDVLITYEREDGRRRWVDCPACRNVVRPVID